MVPKVADRFTSMDQGAANDECRSRNAQVFDQCPSCKQRVALHCSTCKIQVTGCLCTEVDRFGNDEAWKRAVERWGEEMARDQYRSAGLYVPEAPRLIVPGEE